MTKAGAVAILTTIFLGLAGWAGTEIIEHSVEIAKIKKENETTLTLLKEVRDDVKIILQRKR